MNFKRFGTYLLALLVMTACSKEDTTGDDGGDSVGDAETQVTFAAGAKLQVQVGTDAPTPSPITGTITNTDGLASYTAYYTHNGGTRTQVGTPVDLAGKTTYDFSIEAPYPSTAADGETGEILLKVTPAHGTIKNATLPISFTGEEVTEPGDYTDDTEDYAKLPEDLTITEAKAFPTAEGYGKAVTGGRGGTVYVVTSLSDANVAGTLRYAVQKSGARIVVFQVGGTIELNTTLKISNGDITIMGQTAPGDGICLAGASLQVDASNVIIRYIRSRPGRGAGDGVDAAWGRKRKNVILDHCSFTWSTDEAASFYANENFTMQYCIVGQSLYDGGHSKGNHGYGGIWGGAPATFHHNLIVSNDSRNPRFDGNRAGTDMNGRDQVDFINNVIFNWGGNSAYGGEGSDYNIVNNYYKPGPATNDGVSARIMEIYDPTRAASDGATTAEEGRYYVSGNYVHGSESVTADNSTGMTTNKSYDISKLLESSPIADYSFTPETAETAYESVLAGVGASKVYDSVDAELVNFLETGKTTLGDSWGANSGIIDYTTIELNGYPELASGVVTDADGDGMADAWEVLNGLDPADKSDANTKTLNEYYTNIEMFANSLVDF
ncbi:MAG: polysaccharide lyase family 1 protein [Mangrovibacterium sp.]